jgi:hypothetical protein
MSGRTRLSTTTISGTRRDSQRLGRRGRQFAWHALVALQVAGLVLSMLGAAALAGSNPTITSDLADYNPGGTVSLTGAGWDPAEPVHIVVNDTIGQTWKHTADVVASDDGLVSDTFQLPNYFVSDYDVTATGPTSGTATTTFTDANPSADLDQCANGSLASPNVPACDPDEWVNGNLGESKSHYLEGDSIPYRLKFGSLSLSSHTVIIEWDTTKSGKHAIDYLTTFNRTITTANPCAGVSGCSAFTSFAIPADPQVTGAGVTPIAGNFTLYGGTISSVSAYSYPDGTGFAGDKSARLSIIFTPTVANPVLAWGGHIATRGDWGATGAAVSIPGSPYHTRLISLDGSGGNQDRSLSAAAVIFPASITIIKDAVPDSAQDFGFTTTGGLTPSTFTLDDDTDSTWSNSQLYSGIIDFTAYTFTEGAASGWALTFGDPVCTVTSANGGTQSSASRTITVDLKEGENVSCTFTNTQQTGTLTVIKHVVNNDGGTATAGNWSLHVKQGSSEVTGSPQAGSESGTSYTLPGGTYDVTETGAPSGYTLSGYSGDCNSSGSVTVVVNQTKTCTLTNADDTPTLKLVKTVTNNDGGTAGPADFTLAATAATPNDGRNFTSATASPTFHSVFAGVDYTLSETGPAGYTAGTWSCDGGNLVGTTLSVALGAAVTCTIGNADDTPTLLLQKNVVNDCGGTMTAADWTLSAATTATGFTSRNFSDAGNATVASNIFAGKVYNLSESTVYGYSSTGEWTCDVGSLNLAKNAITLALGQHATCTITNDDLPGTIIVQKVVKPAGSLTSFSFDASGTGYIDFALAGGQQNSQTLSAGSYSVMELVPAGWVLTGIGGSTDPQTPYNCTVTGSGGSSGVGSLNTQTATISLKNGDTVTCVFENSAPNTTRTQGFWSTHPQLAHIAWFGGTAFGHTFPGVASVSGIGDTLICGRALDTDAKVMGAFWSGISKTSTGAKRSALDQARMQLLQQLIAAELNASAFGSTPSAGSFAAWETVLCGTNLNAIKTAQSQAASFNESGDSGAFTPGTSADSKTAKSTADIAFWDMIVP